MKNKLVLFGAGKIGRSFIGQLFSRGGYDVVFIDVDKSLIDELNRRKNYNVIIKEDEERILNIKNVRGLYSDDENNIIDEISTASILAVSIGQKGISKIMTVLSQGLLKRYSNDPDLALDIILAENLRDAGLIFHENLKDYLPDYYPLDKLVGLIETSIGKMVPIMRQKDLKEDILQVFAESYNILILDKRAFKNPIPAIEGLAPKENMKAWVDRKLFIHNLGHAAAAYLGYLYYPQYIYLYEVLGVPEIFDQVRETMLQSADILMILYPEEFSSESLTSHIDDLLLRFQNRSLGDTVYRVGCDLYRKLSAHDRLAGAIHLALEAKLPYDKILFALVCGCRFKAVGEDGQMFHQDLEFQNLYQRGIRYILTEVCGFTDEKHSELIRKAEETDQELNSKFAGLAYNDKFHK